MNIIVSKANQALAFPLTDKMRTLFPEAKVLSTPTGALGVIKHGLAEYVLLRRLGYRVPNPMMCYYNWAGGRPYDVQKVTCSLLTSNPRAYVLNDMGTGKTKCALWAFDYLRSNFFAQKMLVVAPRSTLNFVWARECFATVPHLKAVVLYGSKKRRLELLAEDADIYIINNDGVKVIRNELERKLGLDVLLLDELARYRNLNERSKHMQKFAEKFSFVWGMTGSPMPHEPTDVWMQCKIVTPHTVPKYRGHARDVLMTKQAEHIYIPKPNAVDIAHQWMQPAVRFSLDDVVELPDVTESDIDIPLGPKQKQVYSTLAREYIVRVGRHEINAANAGVAMNKLLQVSSGWVYAGEFGTLKLDADDRLRTLRTLIMSTTGKVIVFSAFKHTVKGISEYLTGNGPEDEDYIEHATVTGDTSQKDRDHIFNAFQNSTKYKVINAHPGCMSHGLTLTSADTLIWFGPVTSLETYEQANARIRRVGQTSKQRIIHLQSTPVERKIYRLLRTKAINQDRLLEMFEGATLAAQE